MWTPAPELDPSALKPDRPRRSKADKPADDAPVKLITDEAVEFVGKYIGHDPQVRATIIDAAIRGGVKESRAKRLLAAAEGRKLAFRWTGGPRAPIQFATVAQPALAATEGAK